MSAEAPSPADRSHVDAILLAALRRFLGVGDPGALARHLRQWTGPPDLLLQHADEQGLAGVLLDVLPPAALDEQPCLAPALRRRRLQIFAHNARVLETLEHLGAELRKTDLQVIALKGAALLMGPYRHRMGCRPLSDIDLLVRRRHLSDLRATLARIGWRPHGTRWRGDGHEIDLHTDLGRCELLGQRHAAFRFGIDKLWRDAVPSPTGGPAILLLAPETQAIHLATHAVKHSFSRWIWWLDLCLFLPTVPIEALEAEAEAVRAKRALAYCALLLQQIGLPAPAWRRTLPKLGVLESTWLSLVTERRQAIGSEATGPALGRIGPGRIGLGNVIAGLSIPRLGERLAYWWEVAFPSSRRLRLAAPLHRDQSRSRWFLGSLLPRTRQIMRLITSILPALMMRDQPRATSRRATITEP